MNPLNDAFVNTVVRKVTKEISRRLTDLVVQKAEAQGFTLSTRQRARVSARFRRHDFSPINFREQQFKDRTVSIVITPEESKELTTLMGRMSSAATKALPDTALKIAKGLTADLKSRWPEENKRQKAGALRFRKGLQKRWAEPLAALAMLIRVCREVGEKLTSESIGSPAEWKALPVVLRSLHARACQVSEEVMTLLRNGFADGAMARWRTLHEISVVAVFIFDHGEDLAQRYVDHLVVDARRAADQYLLFQKRAKLKPFGKARRRKIERDYLAIVSKYEPAFCEEYGWAAAHLPKTKKKKVNPKPNFSHIEAAIERDHLRPYYKLASQNVHASPKGAFFKLGMPEGHRLLLAGPSTFGLVDPGQNTALSLVLTTMAQLRLVKPMSIDVLVEILAARELADFVCREFARAHRAQRRPTRTGRDTHAPGLDQNGVTIGRI